MFVVLHTFHVYIPCNSTGLSATNSSPIIFNLFVQKRLGDVATKLNKYELRRDVPKYVIDAQDFGNVSRFLNHSCDPNVFVQCVLSGHDDFNLPRIVMYAADHIHPLEVRLLATSHFYSNCDSSPFYMS